MFNANDVLAVGAEVAASANNQTLAGAASKRTYISGFAVSGGGATAASVISVTVTGLSNSQSLAFDLPIPAGATAGVIPLVVNFDPPLPASADNAAIVVNVPSFGAGNTKASASAWGFQA